MAELMSLTDAVERRWGRKKRQEISSSLFAARKVAIETAANLELGEILVTAACDPSPAVRMHAAQHIHQLWNQNDEVGLETLSSLSERVKNWLGIPRTTVLESIIGASVLIAVEHYTDARAMRSLQGIWRRILDKLLFIRGSERGIWGRLRKRIRGSIVFLIARLLVRLMRQFGSPRSLLTVPEIDHFIHLDPNEKQKVKRLLPYLNPRYGSLEDIQDDLTTIGRTRELFVAYLGHLILSVRSIQGNEDVAPILEAMFREWRELDPPGPAMLTILNCLAAILSRPQEAADEALDLLGKYVWAFYERSNGVYQTDIEQYQHSGLEFLLLRNYEVRGAYYPDGLESYLAHSKALRGYDLHRQLVYYQETEVTFSTLDIVAACGYPTLVLRVAELLLDAEDEHIQRGLYLFLARLRRSYQDAVDDFIEEFKLQASDIRQAEADVSALTIGDFLDFASVRFVLSLPFQPTVLQQVYTLYEDMLESNSVGGFFELFVKRIVNFVYGSPVFDITGATEVSEFPEIRSTP